jgi:hypothetical protein
MSIGRFVDIIGVLALVEYSIRIGELRLCRSAASINLGASLLEYIIGMGVWLGALCGVVGAALRLLWWSFGFRS